MTIEQMIGRYLAAYGGLRTSAGRQVGALWATLGGVDAAAERRFPAAAAAVVLGAETAAIGLLAGYLQVLGRELADGAPLAPAAKALTGAALRGGVDPLEVYTRPIITARKALAEGKRFEEAMRMAGARAELTAETDVVLAQRAGMDAVAKADGRITGYRRVLTGTSCAFCATASTQRYRKGELMPIHARCDCGVAPIWGKSDPGHVINRKLVRDLKQAAKSTGDADYWQSRHITVESDGTVNFPQLVVRDHGELGPVLADRHDHFTDAEDLAA